MTIHRFRHEAMATYFEINVAGQAERYARQAATAAFRELDRLEQELSRFIESSDVARLNRLQQGETARVGADAFECLLAAADAAIATGRAFDAAYASDRDPGDDAPPFTLDPATCTVTSRVRRLHVDLGAIGKGFALDRMADILREWQIRCACLVSGGSSVLALAAPPDTPGWEAGIGDRRLALSDAALGASGISVKGEHIADPRTGGPPPRATRTWALAPSAALADALSTAFFVLPESEIAAFCAAHPEIGAATLSPRESVVAYGRLAHELDLERH